MTAKLNISLYDYEPTLELEMGHGLSLVILHRAALTSYTTVT